jgi:hypothetical protein
MVTGMTRAIADDVVDLSLSPRVNGFAITARCDENCFFSSLSSRGPATPAPRLGFTTYDPASFGLGNPATGDFFEVTNGVAAIDGMAPARLAFDGLSFIYVGAQLPSGQLIIQRRRISDGGLDFTLSSTGPLTLVDLIRGPAGASVIALAEVRQSGVLWGASTTTLPYTPGSGGNVVVIRVDAFGSAALGFDRGGDQRPVALVHGGDGRLGIVLNEGPNAVFWRAPIP